ncbi:hypothetical protein ACKWTF_000621 [Chironomus riparius]
MYIHADSTSSSFIHCSNLGNKSLRLVSITYNQMELSQQQKKLLELNHLRSFCRKSLANFEKFIQFLFYYKAQPECQNIKNDDSQKIHTTNRQTLQMIIESFPDGLQIRRLIA